MNAQEIIEKYITFFEKRGHKRITNSPLVPQNDPTTLFTSSGMQPLIPYLLGEKHPMGKRLVNVQNCFRSQDIDEVGDNRHTTFFRMLGNWSLGDYFKKEQLSWIWEILTKEFKLPKEKLFISIYNGTLPIQKNGTVEDITKDAESEKIWFEILEKEGFNPKERIFYYSEEKNWWSRSGIPKNMPIGEIGGPDSEIFYDFGEDLKIHEESEFKNKKCHPNCDCGRFIEIANSVFMQYQKITENAFKELSQTNVDYGGGLERLLAAVENQNDIFQTSLLAPIIESIESNASKDYKNNSKEMRIIADHLTAAIFIASDNIIPSNKEQGYVLRRLIRRALDNFYKLKKEDMAPILQTIIEQYGKTDNYLMEKLETIKDTILEEEKVYSKVLSSKNINIVKSELPDTTTSKAILSMNLNKYIGTKDVDTFMRTNNFGSLPSVASGTVAFNVQSTLGFPIDQTINLAQQKIGTPFNQEEATKTFNIFRNIHQNVSRAGAEKKFSGGLADHSEKTIMGHTATHLLHKVLRDLLGNSVHQTGSNITPERVRFDFNFDRNLTPDELKKIEDIVNEKIKENLPVHFEMLPLQKAKKVGAIGLFDNKYEQTVKVYFIGPKTKDQKPYSIELCGGPHVTFTSEVKSFRIIKQENIGKGNRRIYAKVG